MTDARGSDRAELVQTLGPTISRLASVADFGRLIRLVREEARNWFNVSWFRAAAGPTSIGAPAISRLLERHFYIVYIAC